MCNSLIHLDCLVMSPWALLSLLFWCWDHVSMPVCECAGVCAGVWVSVPVCECANVYVDQCVSVPVCECTSVCATVCECTGMWVYQCVSVSVCECAGVWVCKCATVWVCQYVSVLACLVFSWGPWVIRIGSSCFHSQHFPSSSVHILLILHRFSESYKWLSTDNSQQVHCRSITTSGVLSTKPQQCGLWQLRRFVAFLWEAGD